MEHINFSTIDGLYSEHQRQVAKVIRDLFPSVRLLRLDPSFPMFDPERPFALVDEPDLAPHYHIRNLAESEIDHRLIAELIKNNMRDPNSEVNKLHLLEAANALLNAKREQDYLEEKKDIMKSAFKSHKSTWTHNGQTLRK